MNSKCSLSTAEAGQTVWDQTNALPHPPRHGLQLSEKQEIALQSIPIRLHPLLKRSFAGKSLRAAVNAKCWECCGFEDRRAIADCPASECPIWSVRPHRSGVQP